MASSSAEWPIGWIISDLTEYLYTVPLLGPNCVQSIKVGNDDDLVWAMGEMHGKRIFLVNATKKWHAYASANMRQRFSIKILFIGGTYMPTNSLHPIGHCDLKMPDIDERRYGRLATSIPGDDIASLAKLIGAKDRVIAGTKEGQFNLDGVICLWFEQNAQVRSGLTLPPATTVSYAEWPGDMNDQMCCGKEFNSGGYTNQIPCLKVLGVAGYRGRADNNVMWLKYATLRSAAAISCMIYEIAL
ncbi:hypothetical protein TGAMA5MH_07881 [Trichoderma gamsii]|uniref:Uncharacterized protein n=1 Tax=Trichoderma gamsii TaxID=398673 RepID=A0A2K0T3X6_9HYPO|nr:hypothetical protein TGAMA5MH_07881 [Trichoderma gamsii]